MIFLNVYYDYKGCSVCYMLWKNHCNISKNEVNRNNWVTQVNILASTFPIVLMLIIDQKTSFFLAFIKGRVFCSVSR